ncbi:hypothetical protein BHM03_00055995 [Ensete ventricosum]|nr:hypothetical protein BHM03_00055995 [Ensete ventricosum]
MVPQRRVFRVYALSLTSDKSPKSTSESHGGGDLIIQRYDQSGWRVGLLHCSHSFKGAQQVRGQDRVLKQVVERGEEAMTSPEGLNYPKVKRQLEIRDGTSMESSIPCSHGGKEFVVKGAEEECLTKKRSRQYVVLYILYSEESTTKLMEKIVLSQR